MSETPTDRDEPDELREDYRRASALDTSRPGEAVRRAVLDHAANLAAERAAGQGGRGTKPTQRVARRTRRPAIFGLLAAAAFAGILTVPHFLPPRPPAAQAPRAEPGAGAGSDQPRVAAMDSASKSNAGAARNAAAPSPRSAPEDPAAAMRRAAAAGHTEELNAVLGAMPDIDARDDGGRTALMLAILHGRTDAVDVLIAHGADPNVRDADGTTPLQAAVRANQQAIMLSLKRAGAR